MIIQVGVTVRARGAEFHTETASKLHPQWRGDELGWMVVGSN